MKHMISKGSVQETLLIPLYGRKMAMEMYPDLFSDWDCQELLDKIDFEAPKMSSLKAKIGAVMAATRQYDMAVSCRRYLKEHPGAAVVNLGCGLDTTFSQIDNGTAVGYHVDFPDVIQIRKEVLPERERQHDVACDLTDHSWMDAIDFKEENGAVFFASGVFYYIKTEEIKKLLCTLARRFPGGKIVFDATTAKGLKNMLKTWLIDADMKTVGLYFSVENEKDLAAWSKDFSSVIHKGYMTGYRTLDKRYGLLANALFTIVDKTRMCQIIEIEFKRQKPDVL